MIYTDGGFYPDPENEEEKKITCACGGKVYGYFTCQTWTNASGTWMSCMDCNSALHWSCYEDTDCGWYYTEGLNTRNPRSEENEAKKPSWTPTSIYLSC
jgi:hypothetical protein